MNRVLLVDDDDLLRLALRKALRRKGVDVVESDRGAAALPHLQSGCFQGRPFDVCVLDLRMPGLDGLEVLRRTQGRKVPVVVLTGHGSITDAVEAMRLGASNFVQKPVDADELWPVLTQAAGLGVDEVSADLLGASPQLTALLTQVDQVAQTDEPVLFLGETGTGKELCARRLHEKSSFSDGPFVAFNAACVPHELFESELFGHKKGAFTGANANREGLLCAANTGTLFIDEVGDLPLDAQAKLLRALEQRTYRPVGSDDEKPFRARICAATHQDLSTMVERKTFRADLYYRLGVFPLHIPPLRERIGDVQLLAQAWLERLSNGERKFSLSDGAVSCLEEYTFAGNVRELINLMKRVVIFASNDVITADDLKPLMRVSPFLLSVAREGVGESISGPKVGQHITMEALEREHISRLLQELHNVSEVARIVGIDRRTLQRKMVAWGLRDAQQQQQQ